MNKTSISKLVRQSETIWEAIKISGLSRNTIRKWMKVHGIATPAGFYSRGRKIGRPRGLPMPQQQKELRSKMFHGKGNPFYGKKHSMKTRKIMSANHANFSRDLNPQWAGAGDIDGAYFGRIRSNAKERGHEFSVDVEFLWNLFLGQKKTCSLTGRPLSINPRGNKQTASLDRIDNSKGYIIGNLHWVHKDVNYAKRTMGLRDFLKMCKEICENSRTIKRRRIT